MAHPAPNSLASRAESLRRAGELAQAERPFAVVTVVRTEPSTSARTGNRAIVFLDGSMEGWVGGGCIQPTARREGLAALEDGEPRLVRITPDTASSQHNVRMARMTCASEGTADLYVEPFLPRPTLIVAGDSPVTDTLAAIAPPLGFRLLALNAGASLTPEEVPHPQDAWMVVATFGGFDEEAVEVGVRLGLPYVGLVANEKRAAQVLSRLRARGLGTEELVVVHSPAGLPLGMSGQEGISLSIMAEISSLRAKSRTSFSEGAGREPTARPDEAVDPVCGMAVVVASAGHVVEHGGMLYYFCCSGCMRAFEDEPEKYAARVSSR
jgi:xanthine dehydrogenase accessory factor